MGYFKWIDELKSGQNKTTADIDEMDNIDVHHALLRLCNEEELLLQYTGITVALKYC